MKTFLYGIMALSVGCPKKAEVGSSPAQEELITEEKKASIAKAFLRQDAENQDGYYCNQYLLLPADKNVILSVCYAKRNAKPLFGGPRFGKKALVAAFSGAPVLYVDKKGDGTLDSIVALTSNTTWKEIPLDTLDEEDKELVLWNYNVALDIIVNDATAEE